MISAPFWQWAVVSMLLGLGFTFFSGAVEAWLVDALHFAEYEGGLESVLGRGQMIGGVAMLGGSVAGGVIAQATSLGVPFLLRVGVLLAMFVVACRLMHDLGFTPAPVAASPTSHARGVRRLARARTEESAGAVGHARRAVRRRRRHLRLLRAAAVPPGALRRSRGLLRRRARRRHRRRRADPRRLRGAEDPRPVPETDDGVDPRQRRQRASILALLGLTNSFWLALALLAIWGLIFAAEMPIRQAYLNDMIPSQQRATVLSFDSLMGSSGGVVIQPVLGKTADVYSYSTSFVVGAVFQLLAVPFLFRSRREHAPADTAVSLAAAPEVR